MPISFDTMTGLVPEPLANVEMEVVEDEVLLYNPQGTRAIYLNPTAATIWALCDGQRSVGDIIGLIGANYPEETDIASDVTATLHRLQEEGVLVLQ